MLPLELVQEVVTIFVLEEREFQSRSPFRKATKGYLLPLLRVDSQSSSREIQTSLTLMRRNFL